MVDFVVVDLFFSVSLGYFFAFFFHFVSLYWPRDCLGRASLKLPISCRVRR